MDELREWRKLEATDKGDHAGEGIGWPKDKPAEKPKTDAERIKDLESANKSLASENRRLTSDYERSLRELKHTGDELKAERADRRKLTETNARLTDTNSRLTSEIRELREKTAPSPAYERKEVAGAAQAETAHNKPRRKNWFPTDKMGTFGGAAAGAAGAAAVYTHHMSPGAQAVIVAGTGVGVAGIGLGREITDKINGWREKRAAKNADRPET